MDNEQEEMLKQVLEISEENNKKIKTMYRGYIFGQIWHFIYYIIIIGIAIGAFYYLQPYIDTFNRVYHYISGTPTSTSSSVADFFKRF